MAIVTRSFTPAGCKGASVVLLVGLTLLLFLSGNGAAAAGPGLEKSGDIPPVIKLAVRNNNLWILGERVTTTTVELRFDGDTLFYGSEPLAPGREVRLRASRIDSLYRDVPVYRSLRDGGLTAWAASDSFEARIEVTIRQAARAYLAAMPSGKAVAGDSAIAVFERSGLIAVRGSSCPPGFDPSPPSVNVCFLGQGGRETIELSAAVPGKPARGTVARRVLQGLQETLAASSSTLILVSSGGISIYGGSNAPKGEAQLEYVLRTGDLSSLPQGPLHRSDPYLAKVIRRRARQ